MNRHVHHDTRQPTRRDGAIDPNGGASTPTMAVNRARRALSLWLAAAVVLLAAACTATPPEEDDALGTLVVLVNGLPAAASPVVTVTSTAGFAETLNGSDTLAGLEAGSYSVSAATTSHDGIEYTAAVTGSPASVTPNGVATATVTYTATSVEPGDLVVTVSGLPAGVDADVTVTGDGFDQDVTASTTFTGVEPGVYSATAAEVDAGGDVYAASVTGSPATVSAGGSATISVTYTFLDPAGLGSLAVTITGLPSGTDADVTVSGPAGFEQTLLASGTLANLTPGFYAVSGDDVTVNGLTYSPEVDTSPALVTPDDTTTVTVTYLPVSENDGDAQSNPGWSAKFRNTSGAPMSVETILFNGAAPLDVKGIQLVNDIGDPADPGDWLEFELVHGQSNTTTVTFALECLTAFTGPSPIKVELRDDAGSKIGTTVTCGTTKNIAIPNQGGSGDYLVSVLPNLQGPYYMRYELSIDAYCFQACAYVPFQP